MRAACSPKYVKLEKTFYIQCREVSKTELHPNLKWNAKFKFIFLPQNKTQTKKGYTKQRRKKKEQKRGWEPHEEAIRFIISGFLAKKTEDKKTA